MHFQVTTRTDHPTTIPTVARELRQLISGRGTGRPSRRELADARLLLDSLPLATDEFAVAKQRLKNADRYVRSSEWGAARYELRLLEGMVARYLA